MLHQQEIKLERGGKKGYILSLCICRMSGTNVRDNEMSGKMLGDV